MTRDEAITKVNACGLTSHVVDGLVALGLLKLDEPKAPYEILAAELGWADVNTRHLKATLDRCGLRVVAS